jgi:ABC-type bacteriocin/lantibiotic exporter with double-glycine peptidase domain
VGDAGERRQEALEHMSRRLSGALRHPAETRRQRRFHDAVDRVMSADVRLGWLEAGNRYGSAALAKLAPIGVVVLAAAQGGYKPGTLLSLYLLAERAFTGADSLADVSLDVEAVRGATRRCFELIDAAGRTHPAATTPPAIELPGAP